MLRALAVISTLLGLLSAAPAAAQEQSVVELEAPPPVCGTEPVTIARMQWPSAELLAEIHARLLRQTFGCEVTVVPGDMAATGSSMISTGQPQVAPELWIARIAEIWNAGAGSQMVRQAGVTYAEPVLEGWFVPDYVVAEHPDLTTVAALQTQWQLFAGGLPKGRFISCPSDWGCSVVNRNLLKANGLDQFFEIVEPANRFELDTLIAEAVSRREPILFYYWQPNSVLAQFAFKSLDLGPYNKDNFLCLGRVTCPSPQPTGFPPEPVIIAIAQVMFLERPEIANYFTRAQMPVAEMNALLQELSLQGATVEAVADNFVLKRPNVWRPWAGLPLLEEPAPSVTELPATPQQ
ncbi:MAG TPA: glycine betaine ABC transporter substrate-binding protein [Bauldia sp.]|nr:glycine betaine ABC transporter substrate-binding protein [Bauldia sp.]